MSIVPVIAILLAPAFALAAAMASSRRRRRARYRRELSLRIEQAEPMAPPAPEPAKVDPFELPSGV